MLRLLHGLEVFNEFQRLVESMVLGMSIREKNTYTFSVGIKICVDNNFVLIVYHYNTNL